MAFNFKKYSSTLGGVLMSILLAVGSLFIIMILYFYVYLPQVTNHGETITVPNVVGMNYSELEDFLGNLDLRYEVGDSTYSGNYPPLTVLKQYPPAGAKVKENRMIDITLNQLMPPNVPVPNLIDGSLIDADAVLRTNELKRGHVELVRGPFQIVTGMKYKGHPIQPGERVPKGSVIDLVVMDGGVKDFTTPNLLGKEWDEAEFQVIGSDLNIDIKIVGDTTGVVSVVLKQKPEAGEKILIGDIVTIWIGAAGTPVEEDDFN
ncbi:MAG TPA: PASTA domain-containing protein [Cyclobacteriaceae bacterium]|nr:PASTA domain-containing protein [Cyclobacteriaceae bacterium]HMV09615.1 PASTA domain-containing protein [Cyclobacteriaceae bacterium]HMV90232.1 PASTA domain-containing protein [Cyclobacteriaceae bacterium]HMX01053.1 PASTA domain-containing protein [Cyclobacteriaceae bacterium]HMX51776.1 PASTA domain-containing protein [Cyclobacteriaceae bacterium]